MRKDRRKRVILDGLKNSKMVIILFLAITVVNGVVFGLYDILIEAFFYAEALELVILIIMLVVRCWQELKAAEAREAFSNGVLAGGMKMPDPRNASEEDYQEIITVISAEMEKMSSDFFSRKQEADEYYTTWVHQIKTPVAVMKLRLNDDTEEGRALLAELFRIEQYVQMVLEYVRLESETTDLVIREYSADEIIKEVVRKCASQFIQRKLRLVYEPTSIKLICDKKNLMFILEQLITNAIKYTPEGEIRIRVSKNQIKVEDTGIGIAGEDLPRIFEKGYTGLNGRLDKKSSGLGLFLCKKSANLISVKISCESEVGKGSVFTLDFPEK